ncbi:MAG: hypothetical protein ABI165_07510 [Bryobacteraceae bacterium]
MFTGGVVFGGTFNGNPISLAGANACLEELARARGIPLQVTGFGAALALHFTPAEKPAD